MWRGGGSQQQARALMGAPGFLEPSAFIRGLAAARGGEDSCPSNQEAWMVPERRKADSWVNGLLCIALCLVVHQAYNCGVHKAEKKKGRTEEGKDRREESMAILEF